MEAKALIEALKELARLVLLALPGIALQVVTNDPQLSAAYGGIVLVVLRGLDKYIHASRSDKNGLLPF